MIGHFTNRFYSFNQFPYDRKIKTICDFIVVILVNGN